jgi:uncharacterized protein YhaN
MRICKLNQEQKSEAPEYTQRGFDKQLNYSLWSTARTRFTASKRLQRKHELSGRTIAFISAYLILLSLIQLFSKEDGLNQLITYSSISLAIVILVVSQIESSSNYALRAHKHHECGLQLNSLYKKLRRLKGKYETKEKDDEYRNEITNLDESYESILARFENHENIDYEMFKAQYPKYRDHGCSKFYIIKTGVSYYFKTQLLYQLMIFIPPIILGMLLLHTLGFYELSFLKKP